MKKCKACGKPCNGKYCSKMCAKKDMMKEATEKVCKECGKPISKGKYCKACEKKMMKESDMSFKDMVKAYLRERSGFGRGVKAMAKSAGISPAEEKKETHKLEKKGVMKGIKNRAKGASDPNAYIFGTERKIMKAHAAKMKRGGK